jgi:hypothetical protein
VQQRSGLYKTLVVDACSPACPSNGKYVSLCKAQAYDQTVAAFSYDWS